MEKVLSFLKDLTKNNNREWFGDNKPIYLEAKSLFDEFIEDLILRMTNVDPGLKGASVKNSVYRIYRDVRFSHDKSPYKTHFGAFMVGEGRKSGMGGYYVHIDPEQSFLGGGIYSPDSAKLKIIRKEIFDFPEDINEILNDPVFKRDFKLYDKDKLKRPPKGYSDDFELIEVLKHKHFIASANFPESLIAHPDFSKKICNKLSALVPLTSFLNRALTSPQD